MKNKSGVVFGNYVDLFKREIFPAALHFLDGRISNVEKLPDRKFNNYILPGFVDSHVHIESSMLLPQRFSEILVPRGTIAAVSDPHEIANVLGVDGIMNVIVANSKFAQCKFFFTVPSCVPAIEQAKGGASVSASQVSELFNTGKFVGLSEVMDTNAVISNQTEMIQKLDSAKKMSLPIDGHAPLLSGEDLKKYISAGVSSDHECSSLNEALEKQKCGMKIIIREGSAAKNFNELKELISICPDSLLFCTDDSHPDRIINEGGVDYIVRTAVKDGFDVFDVLRIASVNPVLHYSLPVGLLRISDPADFIVVRNLKNFEVLETYIDGKMVYNGRSLSDEKVDALKFRKSGKNNKFLLNPIKIESLSKSLSPGKYYGIGVTDGSLITDKISFSINNTTQNLESIIDEDILKIVFINRYSKDSKPQVAYIKGFGLKHGAIASSVSHDAHNIIAIGTNDNDLLFAINALVENKGGLSFYSNGRKTILPLPIGGIISDKTGKDVKRLLLTLKNKVRSSGCKMKDPFMTLSFLSLLVIPHIKIGDRGLFDFASFDFIEQ